MDLDKLLSRAGDSVLQEILGEPTVRLLMQLDPQMMQPTTLRRLIIAMHTREGLLLSKSCRKELIDLLRPPEARTLASVLGIDTQNVYVALQNTSIRRGSNREKALFDFFELPVPPIQTPEQVDSAIQMQPAYGLYDHQRIAARKVKRLLESVVPRVVLHMPTGSGKTRTTMSIIADHLRNHEPTVVVWLAYSEELCEQAATEFEQTWEHIGDRSVQVFRYWGEHEPDLDRLSDGIIIAGLAKLYAYLKRDFRPFGRLGHRASLVVMDEAHQAVAETYRLLLESLTLNFTTDTALLGLTATPGRTWSDIDQDERLANLFARQKVTLEVEGFANPVEYLIDEKYLAQPVFRSLFADIGFELSVQDWQQIRDAFDIPQSLLQRLADDEARNLRIVSEIEDLVKRHRRILVFATTVEHAELLAAILQARGMWARAVTGNTASNERSRVIAEYMNSSEEPKILCNYGVLTTGFDAPQTSAAIIARPTKSLVLYSQMVGRAMRGPRVGGNASAEIVTVVDFELPGFGDFAEAFTNWEDIWNESTDTYN